MRLDASVTDTYIGSQNLGASLKATTTSAPATQTYNRAAFASAVEKINTFLLQQDVTLSILFNVLDTNSDNTL